MNYQIFATAFGGAAFGAVITGIINIWLNKKNYKNDYYKKIIDKRMNAYDELEQFLKWFNVEHDYNGNKLYHCYIHLERTEDCREATNKSVSLCGLKSWFSENVANLLDELNKTLANLEDEMELHIKEPYGVISVASKNHANIQRIIENLIEGMINDRPKLHEVESFLHEKTQSHNLLIKKHFNFNGYSFHVEIQKKQNK